MVADLPATGATAKATAKSVGKTQLRKDNQHIRERQTLIECIGQFESYRDQFIREKEEVPQAVHDKLAAGITALATHDKKYANDNSIKTIAELTHTPSPTSTRKSKTSKPAFWKASSICSTRSPQGNSSWKNSSRNRMCFLKNDEPRGHAATNTQSERMIPPHRHGRRGGDHQRQADTRH